MNSISSIISLVRLPNCLMSALVVITASYLRPYAPAGGMLALAALGAFMLTAYGNVHNDIIDLESDRLNHPERSLPSGRLGLTAARITMIICLVPGLLFSFFLNVVCFRIAVLVSVMLFFYSTVVKRIPLLANLWVAVMAGLTFIYAGYLYPGFRIFELNLVSAGALFAFWFHLGREIIKDLQDRDGDNQAGISTLANRVPLFWSRIAISISFLPVLALGIFIQIFLKPGWEFIVTFLFGIMVPILVFTGMIWRYDSRRNYRLVSAVLKAIMPLGLAALLLARHKLPLDSL